MKNLSDIVYMDSNNSQLLIKLIKRNEYLEKINKKLAQKNISLLKSKRNIKNNNNILKIELDEEQRFRIEVEKTNKIEASYRNQLEMSFTEDITKLRTELTNERKNNLEFDWIDIVEK